MCVLMLGMLCCNYFLTADQERQRDAHKMQIAGSSLSLSLSLSQSVCMGYVFCPSRAVRSTLRWAITGATVHSKVLPNDHSLNYVVFHIL